MVGQGAVGSVGVWYGLISCGLARRAGDWLGPAWCGGVR